MILDGALLPPGCPCVDGGATAQVAVDGMASSGKCFVNLYIVCPRWRLTASLTLLTSLNSMTWTGHQRGRFSHQKFTRAMALNCSMIYRSYYYHLLHLFFLLILSLSLSILWMEMLNRLWLAKKVTHRRAVIHVFWSAAFNYRHYLLPPFLSFFCNKSNEKQKKNQTQSPINTLDCQRVQFFVCLYKCVCVKERMSVSLSSWPTKSAPY